MLTVITTAFCTAAWLYVGFWSYVYWSDKIVPHGKNNWDWKEMNRGLKFSIIGPVSYIVGKVVYNEINEKN